MNNELMINGKQSFMGKEIPVVLGGFGQDKKCMSDKTIAEIHNQPEREIRRRVTDNIKRFKDSIDFIDLKQRVGESHTLELLISMGYSKQSITQAEHIYLLSERGYAKLIKIMDSDLAWEIHDKLIDEYFHLKEFKKVTIQNERLASVNNAVKILTPMLQKAGCNSTIQLLTAKSLYEKAGVSIPIVILADQQYFDTVQIARKVGIYTKSNKPASGAVNEIIRRIIVTEDEYTETWESKNKWQGTVRKYTQSVIEKVQDWLIENDYPDTIEFIAGGDKKRYHVVYKGKVVATA